MIKGTLFTLIPTWCTSQRTAPPFTQKRSLQNFYSNEWPWERSSFSDNSNSTFLPFFKRRMQVHRLSWHQNLYLWATWHELAKIVFPTRSNLTSSDNRICASKSTLDIMKYAYTLQNLFRSKTGFLTQMLSWSLKCSTTSLEKVSTV